MKVILLTASLLITPIVTSAGGLDSILKLGDMEIWNDVGAGRASQAFRTTSSTRNMLRKPQRTVTQDDHDAYIRKYPNGTTRHYVPRINPARFNTGYGNAKSAGKYYSQSGTTTYQSVPYIIRDTKDVWSQLGF